jgi:hypothetical protein
MTKLEKGAVLAEETFRHSFGIYHSDFVILRCSPGGARYNRPVIA